MITLWLSIWQAPIGPVIPADPPYDWAPPVTLASSGIIGQALRFMRLSPIARHDPASDLLPALRDAFDQGIDDLLASCDWSFASTLALLPPSTPPMGSASDDLLPASAMLPGDLVRPRQIWPGGARWRIDGRTLRHDAPGAVTLRYTARVTREEALPATFRTALALHIALRLGGRWAGAGFDPQGIEDAAVTTLKQAMREDGVQASATDWADRRSGGLIYGQDDDWALEACL
jgi:hypothetical protein